MAVIRLLIGTCLTDRDLPFVRNMLTTLSKALQQLPSKIHIDLCLTAGHEDRAVQEEVRSFYPSRINELFISKEFYDEILYRDNLEQSYPDLIAQKNRIRHFARHKKYTHLFYLDRGICLQEDTLKRLFKANKEIVAAPYKMNSFAHPVVIVLNENAERRLLLNPHLLKDRGSSFPCCIVPLGATLLTKKVMHIPLAFHRFEYDLFFDAVDFCLEALQTGFQPYCLSDHTVHNLIADKYGVRFPYIYDAAPALFDKESIKDLVGKVLECPDPLQDSK